MIFDRFDYELFQDLPQGTQPGQGYLFPQARARQGLIYSLNLLLYFIHFHTFVLVVVGTSQISFSFSFRELSWSRLVQYTL